MVLPFKQVPPGSSSGGRTDGRTDHLGKFKTILFLVLKWFYYNLRRELCVFVTFYKSVTDRPTNRWTDTASYRDARMPIGLFVTNCDPKTMSHRSITTKLNA